MSNKELDCRSQNGEFDDNELYEEYMNFCVTRLNTPVGGPAYLSTDEQKKYAIEERRKREAAFTAELVTLTADQIRQMKEDLRRRRNYTKRICEKYSKHLNDPEGTIMAHMLDLQKTVMPLDIDFCRLSIS